MHFAPALIGAAVFVAAVLYVGLAFLLLRTSRRRPRPGHVLVVRSPWGARVVRRSALVLPFVHTCDELDMGDRRIELDLRAPPLVWAGDVALPCEVRVSFGVPDDDARILELDAGIGCMRGSDGALLAALYQESFARRVREVAATLAPPPGTTPEAFAAAVQAALAPVVVPFEVRDVVLRCGGSASGGSSEKGRVPETSP